jgi:hypothetical protein
MPAAGASEIVNHAAIHLPLHENGAFAFKAFPPTM